MLQRRTPMKSGGFKSARGAQVRAADLARRAEELAERREANRKALLSTTGRAAKMSRATTAAAPVPKQPSEKCQHLLDMAKGAPCLFWFVPGCRRDFDPVESCTTVKAHDNRLTANKGKGYKAHDWRSLDACEPCHTAYDQGKKHTREEKDAAFDEAYERQLAKWRRIAADPLSNPRDRAACAWAIERYEHHQSKGEMNHV